MPTEFSEIQSGPRDHSFGRDRHTAKKRFQWNVRVVGVMVAWTLGGLLYTPIARSQEDVGAEPASESAPVVSNVEAVSEAAADSVETAPTTEVDAANDSLFNRLRFALPAEVSVIGLTVGVRPEFLFQPFQSARWFELRAAAGVLPGPEYLSTPLSVGIRGRYLDFPVHPLLGIALTQDIYWISDAAPILRGIVETDVGLSIDVTPQWAIDAVAYGGWGAIGEPGPLAGLRLGVRYTPEAIMSAP